jgi:hypothetical protein
LPHGCQRRGIGRRQFPQPLVDFLLGLRQGGERLVRTASAPKA